METNCLDGQVLYEGTGYILTYSNRDSSFGIDVRSGREELTELEVTMSEVA
jgi:hypothetical protein